MDINKYKQQLLNEKKKITDLIVEMKDNTVFGNTVEQTSEKYTSSELSSYDNHLADIGTEVFMQDMQNSLTIHEQGKLDDIERALYEIENGTYGTCNECNNKIDKDRLDILPETNLCSCCANNHKANYLTRETTNQNLINRGSSFYDDVLLELNEMNEISNGESDLD